ncbi:precorrin-2 dehydrogenase/sirohydrochlorin ferrochelatase family protein [Deinococcus hopiensis]|nr:bifunctional precorrin-2 dehydrogenase/sirohydrochlorin ferrochelatase [Deinococcus hopiensis]
MSLAALLNLRGEPALVVGGGGVALRRTRTLLDAGMQVRVVAPALHPDFATLRVQAEDRPYQPGDARGMRLVVAATGNADVNDTVVAEARAYGALVNHAGDAGRGNLRFPAVTRRGTLQVAVGTGRDLPLLAQALGERIGALLPSPEAVEAWSTRRAAALPLPHAERERSLAALRAEIRAALGLPAEGAA